MDHNKLIVLHSWKNGVGDWDYSLQGCNNNLLPESVPLQIQEEEGIDPGPSQPQENASVNPQSPNIESQQSRETKVKVSY